MKGLALVLLGFLLFSLAIFMAKSTKKKPSKTKITVPNFSTQHREESDWNSGIPGSKKTPEDEGSNLSSMPVLD